MFILSTLHYQYLSKMLAVIKHAVDAIFSFQQHIAYQRTVHDVYSTVQLL